MRSFLVAILVSTQLSMAASDVGSPAALTVSDAPPREVVEIAHEVAKKELGAAGWKKLIKKTLSSYEQWSLDNPAMGSKNSFLNSRLLNLGLSAKDGDIKALKEFVCWLGLYNERDFIGNEDVVPPSYIQAIGVDQRRWLEDFVKEVSWEKFAAKVRDKVSEYELKEKEKKK